MSFELTRGIAAYDCPDHYATLGVTLDASPGEIRKRYLRIARNLHPDSRGPGTDAQQASQLLSKLVNPAYETLSHDKEREEYRILIRLVSQRVSLEPEQRLQTDSAKAVLEANDFAALYKETVEQLAKTQYQSLEHVQSVIEQLSELNLAYLLRQENMATSSSAAKPKFATSQTTSQTPQSAPAPTSNPSPSSAAPKTAVTSSSPPTTNKPPVDTFVSQYVRRAEELIGKNRFPQAIQELRDGLKLDPQNSQCQSLLGSIYLQQNKWKMAKIHFQQALKLNPADIQARKGMDKIAKQEKKTQGSKAQSADQTSGRKGLFGLFGGKK